MNAVVSAPAGQRSTWLATLRAEAVSFLKGDNNAPWAIFAETVIGLVPIVGQVVDARDIIKGLVEVAAAPASTLAWFNLITALIGRIPGGGDAVKRSLRAVKSGAVHVDDLLAMIRRFYKGDPEKLLRETLDVAKLRKYLDEILDNPKLTRHLSDDVKRQIDQIRANLARQFDAFKKEVDGWLARGRKTAADTGVPTKPRPGSPSQKPATHAKSGTKNKNDHHSDARPREPNAATQRTSRFKTLKQKVLGVLGEHMADYHCQDVKGWGARSRHDEGGKNAAKLNDGSHLVALWPPIPRGRGIDALWKTPGPKPYAVIEAKASYDPTKSLKALLGESGDKTEREGGSGDKSPGRGGGAGRRGGRTSSKGTIRQTNGKVTQMSHGWIERRLPQALATSPDDLARLRRLKSGAYSRHVLFFSIPQAVAHAEALIMHTANRPVQQTMHATHQVTHEWGDNQIERVVNDRAGLSAADRGRGR